MVKIAKKSKKRKVSKANKKEIDFKTGFKFPFNKAIRLWNIFWILVPLVGLFAFMGYTIRIIKQYVKGNFKQLPSFDFIGNLRLGFFMFLKSLPFMVVYMILINLVGRIPQVGTALTILIGIFIVPMLGINFYRKETIAAYFEFEKIKPVFEHFGEYIVALIKSIGLLIVLGIMCIILVGIPALLFTQNIFLADFYRRYAK